MLPRLLFCLLLASPLCAVQANDAKESNAPASTEAARDRALFERNDVLTLSLAADFDTMCRPNEVEDCGYSATTLLLKDDEGHERSMPVEIRVRGGWRARQDHCDVPPLFVKFTDENTQTTPFAGQALLPLTTHCRDGSVQIGGNSGQRYEQYVLDEYLGYRLYNLITEKSLHVRLARIEYTSLSKTGRTYTRYAFFTEHFDDMAARNNGRRLGTGSFDHEKIDLASLDRVALFNFMIGNTDWSAVRQRNIVLISLEDGRQYPVPFDLDMSGLVDAEYSGVSPRLDFRDPRQRYYLGFCHPQPAFQARFAEFLAQKESLLALVSEVPRVNRKSYSKNRRYLQKFFKILESPERSHEDIIDACHAWPPSPNDHTTPPDPEE